MGALERYDAWEAELDPGVTGLDPVTRSDPYPALHALYDPATVAAIDARGARQGSPGHRWRGGIGAGAVAAGLIGAAARPLEDDDAEGEPLVEIERAPVASRQEPVSVYLAWGDPAASVAIVRPWLF